MEPAHRLAFMVHWLDSVSGVTWTYQLMLFPQTLEVELFDVKNRRTFLRKTIIEDLKVEQFFVGSKVTIYGRQLDIVDYGDSFTASCLEQAQQRTLALIKPDGLKHVGKIVNVVYKEGFTVSRLRMCSFSKAEACELLAAHRGEADFEALTGAVAGSSALALELVGRDAVQRWREIMGDPDPQIARAKQPASLRAQYGLDSVRNACHGSSSKDAAHQECAFVFGPGLPGARAPGLGTTLGIIKPHAIVEKAAGLILDDIASKFRIDGMALFNVNKAAAGEFYEVYRGVVSPSEYSGMVNELTSGPCVALEIAQREDDDSVEPFRTLCGPADPEVARALRPASLRARFGTDKNRNAVHCTDLQEDGALEVEYFFRILKPA